jgi:hypothetical protein
MVHRKAQWNAFSWLFIMMAALAALPAAIAPDAMPEALRKP